MFGVANRKSVAWFVARSLEEQGAKVVYSVRSDARRKNRWKRSWPGKPVFICDVEAGVAHPGGPTGAGADRRRRTCAAAVESCTRSRLRTTATGSKPFHETKLGGFSAIWRLPSPRFRSWRSPGRSSRTSPRTRSVVTIGISSLLVTPDNYGYMGLRSRPPASKSSVPVSGEVLQRRQRGAVQRAVGAAGPSQDERIRGHPGLSGELSLRREAHFPKKKPRDLAGSGQHRAVPPERAQQRGERHDARRRCGARLAIISTRKSSGSPCGRRSATFTGPQET